MRTTLRNTALMLLAAAALAGCRDERTRESLEIHILQPVTFNICEMQTKTGFGPGQDGVYPTLWTSNDAAVKLAINYTEAIEAAVKPSEDYRTASFTADVDASQTKAPYTFYAVSPASAAKALSPSRKAWNITIPAVQTPLEGSVDESAMLLASASQPSDAVPQSVDIHFNHLTAYGRMSLTNLKLNGATVNSIEITTTTPIVGDWYWDCTEDHGLTDNGASSTLTLNTSSTSDIWFACAPVDMSGEIAVFTVYTDQGTLVKEVLFPEDRKFKAGHIAVFSVDMSDAQAPATDPDGFYLVTDASVLKEGDEVIIANKEGTYGLGAKNTGGKTPYRQGVSITVADGKITDTGKTTVLTLYAGETDGTWALKASDGYLCTTSTNNSLSTALAISDASSWSVTVTGDGDATLEAQSGDCYIMRFNYNKGTNIRFSAYGPNSSLQDPVAIYRKGGAASGPVTDDPLTEYSQLGFYQGAESRIYVPGTDQYSRRYSDGVQTFAILDPATNEQLEITGYKRSLVKGDQVNVTVNWKKGKDTVMSGKTYNLSVVREDGPMVWLGNGSGNGFIIKK